MRHIPAMSISPSITQYHFILKQTTFVVLSYVNYDLYKYILLEALQALDLDKCVNPPLQQLLLPNLVQQLHARRRTSLPLCILTSLVFVLGRRCF